MCFRSAGIELGGDGEASLFPAGVSRPALAFTGDVGPCGVDFVVAFGLEVVEAALVVVKRSDSRSGFWVWAGKRLALSWVTLRMKVVPKGHGTQNDL